MNNLNGNWTYRSFINDPQEVGSDAQRALALIFGEGKLTVDVTAPSLFRAVLDFGGGAAMDLFGEIVADSGVSPTVLIITGTGRAETSTAGWVYQYKGFVVPQWSEGVNQVPAIVGTVIRTIPHGTGKAGLVASFVIVRATG
jgi:hypothetical protein